MSAIGKNIQYDEGTRGTTASIKYSHPSDGLAAIRGANYFVAGTYMTAEDVNGMRSFIRQRRNTVDEDGTALSAAALARQGVPITLESGAATGGGAEVRAARLSAANVITLA